MMKSRIIRFYLYTYITSVESQKGVIAAQICFAENQKGAIAIDFVQRQCLSGYQRIIFELQ